MTDVVRAHAKLTLSLDITGVRPDGLHIIDAHMVSLDLHDTLTITLGAHGITLGGPFADGVPTNETNLVHKALQLAGVSAAVHIEKNIPAGGGLGGGSTDAAAVLRWAGFTDLEAASAIGADIAFCMVGGHAHVTGIGEIITALPPVSHDFTLIIPPLHVSTALVYAAWDRLGSPRHESGNNLEPAAIAVVPELAHWKTRITQAVGHAPTLAGSGATWFVWGHQNHLVHALPEASVVMTSTHAVTH
ncbi:MAG: 4-(cytidine 5'-diphospho)-2-C-methyl-D-erythritol kinase [Ilumatobacteraceae bacterium]|nr:4-(cytidine 5'-diphospho)-2-C-methyl-D-erythritol kinase [Ilumatobacteraceae bacterium]